MEQIAISLNQLFGWSIGTSVIVACLISALWSIYFNRIKEGQKAEFQKQIENQKSEFTKELEILKAKNDKCNYITKTQFDAEFKMYQELSSSTFEALMTLRIIDKEVYLGDLQKEYNEKWKTESLEKVNSFATIVHKYAPFIEENIFKKLSNLAKQINDINNSIEFDKKGNIIKNDTLIEEEKKVLSAQQNLIADLRKYLRSLLVIEDK